MRDQTKRYREAAKAVMIAMVDAYRVQPDLLGALKACIERLEASQPPEGGRTDAVLLRANAVIARAEGR